MRCIAGVDTILFFTINELPISSDPHCMSVGMHVGIGFEHGNYGI